VKRQGTAVVVGGPHNHPTTGAAATQKSKSECIQTLVLTSPVPITYCATNRRTHMRRSERVRATKQIEASRGRWEPDVKLVPNGSGSSAPNDFGQVDGSGVSTVTWSLVSDTLGVPHG
jgi:hypothetical protein